MINSELREYCGGLIAYYSKDYPYYFMYTNTDISDRYSNQYGSTIAFSKEKPTVKNQYSMTSDEWFVVTVYSSNANWQDDSNRIITSTKSGTITCNEWEYVYSNVESTYAYSLVDTPAYYGGYNSMQIDSFFSVLNCAILLAVVIGIWLKR